MKGRGYSLAERAGDLWGMVKAASELQTDARTNQDAANALATVLSVTERLADELVAEVEKLGGAA